MLDEDGIDVATEDKAAWDAAVAEFKKTLRDARTMQTFSSVGGRVEAEAIRSEHGTNGSDAILS